MTRPPPGRPDAGPGRAVGAEDVSSLNTHSRGGGTEERQSPHKWKRHRCEEEPGRKMFKKKKYTREFIEVLHPPSKPSRTLKKGTF